MCDMGPDVRGRELSEDFVTSPRAHTLRGRAEHAVESAVMCESQTGGLAWTPVFGP